VAVAALGLGCGGGPGHGNDNTNAGCAEGFERQGPACVPHFVHPEDCAPVQIPVFGGGCRTVGVVGCALGFAADDEGGCVPLLPERDGPGVDPCPAGTMEVLGETECQPVGVPGCDPGGFVPDGDGGCEAVLPEADCPAGTMEVLGATECQPVGDCHDGDADPWAGIPEDADTVYVDASADASGANGTRDAPFPRLGLALEQVLPEGQVAVAAGEYVERLVIDAPVRLTGRCAGRVTLRGLSTAGQDYPPLSLSASATGTTLTGLTLTGPGRGLVVNGARQVDVIAVQVLDTGDTGLQVNAGSEVWLQRVLVTGATRLGVSATGAEVMLASSVVRSTRPQPGTDTLGRGVNAQCDTASGACGGVGVSGSLLSDNHEVGLFVGGADAAISGSVIRRTRPRVSDGTAGGGIDAECHPTVGACGRLIVTGSLITENHQAGLYAGGVDTEIVDSIVQGTLPQARSQIAGRGIVAQCDRTLGTCAPLAVRTSRVSGNREVGVYLGGVDAVLEGTEVRGTLAQASDSAFGWGVLARCDAEVPACGSLAVHGSLITGNREVGVFTQGAPLTLSESVVRDTQPTEVERFGGRAVSAQCHADLGDCGALEVSRSLLADNREAGIAVWGVDAVIRDTVVRDTEAQESDQLFGRGISAECDADVGICGRLEVSGAVLEGNREAGIAVWGVDTAIRGTTVRHTRALAELGSEGRGVNAQCHPDLGDCGRLEVSETLVTGCRAVGVYASGVEAEIDGVRVSGTLPQDSDQSFGRGIAAECDPLLGACGRIAVTDSLVTGSHNAGVFLYGVPATLQGVVVTGTRSDAGGIDQGDFGQGIWAMCDEATWTCGTLELRACLVEGNATAGVAAWGVSGLVADSVIRVVDPRPLDERFGYGLQVQGLAGAPEAVMHVQGSWITDAPLASILYYRATGTLARSAVSGADFAVAYASTTSPPADGGGNVLEGRYVSGVSPQDLSPSPAPQPQVDLQP
jgi:hypothetical protein